MNKITITPRKRVVPSFLCYIFALLYLVCVILALLGTYYIINKNMENSICYLGIALILILGLTCCNYLFSWFTIGTIKEENGKIMYLLIDPLSNKSTLAGETRITINKIQTIKPKKHDIIVYGDIKKIEAHRESHPKKIKIVEGLNNPETIIFLQKFQTRHPKS